MPKWICFEKKYDYISITTVCVWIPEVLLEIFRKLCIFLSVYNLILRQQHLLKMVSWICQIIQLKSKLNYYSVSLKTIQRPRGLSSNYFMDEWTKTSPYSCIFPKDLLYSSHPLYFMYILFKSFFPRISEIEFYFDYDIQHDF